MNEILWRKVLDNLERLIGVSILGRDSRYEIRKLIYEHSQYRELFKVASDISFMNCRLSIPSDDLKCNLDVDDYENIQSISFSTITRDIPTVLMKVKTNYDISDLGFKRDKEDYYYIILRDNILEDHLYNTLMKIRSQKKRSNDKIDYIIEYLEEELDR